MHGKNFQRWWTAVITVCLAALLLTGCREKQAPAPAAETASEDMTEAAQAADTVETAVEEEPRLTVETAQVGICLSRTEYGDNERLVGEAEESLRLRGFPAENLHVQDLTGSRKRQEEEIRECLDLGCNVMIVSAVDDTRIPGLADLIAEAGASAIFVNCTPGEEELSRWKKEQVPAVWIGTTYEQELACQMNMLNMFSGMDRGLDFNEDGHIGALVIGGGEQAREALEQAARDLGSEIQILGEMDSADGEEISAYTQQILNEYRKSTELVLCSTEAAAQAAAEGVQLRHRLVGRDILVIGTGAHEDTCTAIINKLMSGSVFTDFYEQANLIAVAAEDLVEGNRKEGSIANVVFKVTEENAQEILDQLWRTRGQEDSGEGGTGAAEGSTESAQQ